MASRRKEPKPIPLGNGKFCYSGPTCKLHSSLQPGLIENKTSIIVVEDMLKDAISAFKKQEQEWVCSQKVSIPSLENYQKRLLDWGSAARWCDEHNVYHVYNILEFKNGIYANGRKEITGELVNLLKANNLPLKDLGLFSHYVSAKLYNQSPSIVDDLKQLREINPENYDAFKERIDKERKIYQSNPVGQYPKLKKNKVSLILDENKIPDAVMLEFWKCYRKKKFSSQQEAETNKQMIDNTAHPYLCNYCDSYHLGHGDGKGSEEATIKKARRMWNQFPTEANSIVNKYNLS